MRAALIKRRQGAFELRRRYQTIKFQKLMKTIQLELYIIATIAYYCPQIIS